MTYQFEDLKNAYPEEWQAYIEHRFVRQLAERATGKRLSETV